MVRSLSFSSDDPNTEAVLPDKMAEIEALIVAIENQVPDCDLRLAALLEGESEAIRIAIVQVLRKLLRERAQEKERELDQLLEQEKRIKVEQQRGQFLQWLQWMMSEETIRKMREAFMGTPALERMVRGAGRSFTGRGVDQVELSDKRDLGGLTTHVPDARGKSRDKSEHER